ncbi:MAG: GNAT family N-acetyltransferase [Actinomycetota bacterium]
MSQPPEQPNGTDRPMNRTRDFRPADQTAVRDLIQAGLRSRWGAGYDPSANPDTDDLTANYLDPGGEIAVVDVDGTPVATGILCVEQPPGFVAAVTGTTPIGRLRRISVSEHHQRRGLGRLIVQDLVRRSAHRGLRYALVSTDTPWVDAVALYESCGFVTVHVDGEETHLLRGTEGL